MKNRDELVFGLSIAVLLVVFLWIMACVVPRAFGISVSAETTYGSFGAIGGPIPTLKPNSDYTFINHPEATVTPTPAQWALDARRMDVPFQNIYDILAAITDILDGGSGFEWDMLSLDINSSGAERGTVNIGSTNATWCSRLQLLDSDGNIKVYLIGGTDAGSGSRPAWTAGTMWLWRLTADESIFTRWLDSSGGITTAANIWAGGNITAAGNFISNGNIISGGVRVVSTFMQQFGIIAENDSWLYTHQSFTGVEEFILPCKADLTYMSVFVSTAPGGTDRATFTVYLGSGTDTGQELVLIGDAASDTSSTVSYSFNANAEVRVKCVADGNANMQQALAWLMFERKE